MIYANKRTSVMRDIMDTGVSFHPPVEEREFTPIVTGHIKISSDLHLRDFESRDMFYYSESQFFSQHFGK